MYENRSENLSRGWNSIAQKRYCPCDVTNNSRLTERAIIARSCVGKVLRSEMLFQCGWNDAKTYDTRQPTNNSNDSNKQLTVLVRVLEWIHRKHWLLTMQYFLENWRFFRRVEKRHVFYGSRYVCCCTQFTPYFFIIHFNIIVSPTLL